MTTLDDLETPCLVLDRAKLERNLSRMSARMRKLGVSLRPHLKTAKSAEVARMATRGEAGGITVSTLAEAEYFAAHGIRDILVAAALAPRKLDRAGGLAERGIRMTLITDSVSGAEAISAHRSPFDVLIEVDSGDSRAGVDPTGDTLLAIAGRLGDRLEGVMTHAGHSYGCRSVECVKEVAEFERRSVVTAAERLRSSGFRCEVVSVGSTPTMTHVESLDGVTEARPGVYMFQDLFQVEVGTCERDDVALTVLASVIGIAESDAHFLVDAGALALSKDRSTAATDNDVGFGEVWDVDGGRLAGDPVVERVYQEHGVVTGAAERPEIGRKVRIGPNHACITAAAHDRYHIVDGGRDVVAVWERVNGW